uniref:Uncharacterized protein n=1 Tax=Oryza meridionalis TaxID=40149 RepID=A0A0E0D676_9ORYZ
MDIFSGGVKQRWQSGRSGGGRSMPTIARRAERKEVRRPGSGLRREETGEGARRPEESMSPASPPLSPPPAASSSGGRGRRGPEDNEDDDGELGCARRPPDGPRERDERRALRRPRHFAALRCDRVKT